MFTVEEIERQAWAKPIDTYADFFAAPPERP